MIWIFENLTAKSIIEITFFNYKTVEINYECQIYSFERWRPREYEKQYKVMTADNGFELNRIGSRVFAWNHVQRNFCLKSYVWLITEAELGLSISHIMV